MGRIQQVDIYIYSCETRDTADGVVDPKYPDDKGRKPSYEPRIPTNEDPIGQGVKTCAAFKVDLSDLDVPIEIRNGDKVYVATIDIEMMLESASLSFCAVYTGGSEEKRSEPKSVSFL